MLNVMKNSALNAKIHAMNGKALTDRDYDALMNLKSVPAVATYLIDNTSYCAAFDGVSPRELHRAGLEHILKENLSRDFKRIKPFMSSGAKKFSEIFAISDGIEKIKLCLRQICIGHSGNVAEYTNGLYGLKRNIDEVASVDEFTELLRETPYYPALGIFAGHPERQELFRMETALDSLWARLVIRYAKKYLSLDEVKSVIKLYGTEFDLENLTFLIRCKKSFEMTEDEMVASIIPMHYKLKKETVLKIVRSNSAAAALGIIAEETPYGQAFSATDRFIDKRQKEYMIKAVRRAARNNEYSVQSPVCYIHRRRTETNNIVSVIEGIRYGLEPDRIKEYLIGYGTGGIDV